MAMPASGKGMRSAVTTQASIEKVPVLWIEHMPGRSGKRLKIFHGPEEEAGGGFYHAVTKGRLPGVYQAIRQL
jgi:hypothetical protein